MSANIDVLGIGNAIMDVIAPVSDDFLNANQVEKGSMTLIEEPRAVELHGKLSQAAKPQEIAGGSAANTLVGIAKLGVSAAYVGKVANDEVGNRFAAGLREAGLEFTSKPLKDDLATARCLIAVTPDGERSMSTFLGASSLLGSQDILRDQIKRAKIVYMEGYLFDRDAAKAAFVKAAEIAQASGHKVSLTLSDLFCVERHRESFKHLVDHHVDILFANESELLSLYPGLSFDDALSALSKAGKIACVTRSEKGSVILADGETHIIPVVPVDKVVDTTGAGDQYAAGVLAGHAMGMSWADAGYLGSQCAAEVISHYGARPERDIL